MFPHVTWLLSGARHTSLKFVEEAAEGKQSEDNTKQGLPGTDGVAPVTLGTSSVRHNAE